jgi:hypothetical protein
VGKLPAAKATFDVTNNATLRHEAAAEEPEAGHEIRVEEETAIQNVTRPRGCVTGTMLATEGAIIPRASRPKYRSCVCIRRELQIIHTPQCFVIPSDNAHLVILWKANHHGLP